MLTRNQKDELAKLECATKRRMRRRWWREAVVKTTAFERAAFGALCLVGAIAGLIWILGALLKFLGLA